jgi:GAF domain-containing protein
MSDRDEQFAQFSAESADLQGVKEAVSRIVRYAVAAVGTPYAGVTLLRPGQQLESMATTDPIVDAADHLQYDLQEGPCLDAAVDRNSHVLLSKDLAVDDRWPQWGPKTAALGLHAVLSAELRAGQRRLGALNLYGEQPRQFSSDDAATAHLFAAHATLALTAASTVEGLQTALDTRTEIGQAQGILMERFDLDADRAFEVLRRYSQNTNLKLHEVARTLIDTRKFPEGP